jgi:hypothetical protein
MMKVEKDTILEAVERIPCEISVLTFDGKTGSAWLGCNECSRCLLLKALSFRDPEGFIIEYILKKPVNGGYQLREEIRNQNGRLIRKPAAQKEN